MPLRIDRIERAVVKDNVQLLVIDYLQKCDSDHQISDPTNQIIEVLKRLGALITTRNVALLMVTNVAKGVDRHTEIGNIGKLSNQIDYDSDNFLYGHKTDETGGDGEMKVIWFCKKLRQGEPRDIELWFHGKYQAFEDTSVGEIAEFAQWSP
jgi:replicative DNA helicase